MEAELSEEIFLFWKCVQAFKETPTMQVADYIVSEFILEKSSRKVTFSSDVRNQIQLDYDKAKDEVKLLIS